MCAHVQLRGTGAEYWQSCNKVNMKIHAIINATTAVEAAEEYARESEERNQSIVIWCLVICEFICLVCATWQTLGLFKRIASGAWSYNVENRTASEKRKKLS